jgi:hypothetical protein
MIGVCDGKHRFLPLAHGAATATSERAVSFVLPGD